MVPFASHKFAELNMGFLVEKGLKRSVVYPKRLRLATSRHTMNAETMQRLG